MGRDEDYPEMSYERRPRNISYWMNSFFGALFSIQVLTLWNFSAYKDCSIFVEGVFNWINITILKLENIIWGKF